MAILRNQRGKNDCGPTCFANTLNILGYDINISRANKICSLGRHGTDSDDLTQAFEKFGFEVKERVYNEPEKAWSWLRRDTNRGFPLILAADSDSHWILALRAGEKEIQIFDPLDKQPTKITKEELLERWDCASETQKEFYMGLIIRPFKKKAAEAIYLRKQILKTVDVK